MCFLKTSTFLTSFINVLSLPGYIVSIICFPFFLTFESLTLSLYLPFSLASILTSCLDFDWLNLYSSSLIFSSITSLNNQLQEKSKKEEENIVKKEEKKEKKEKKDEKKQEKKNGGNDVQNIDDIMEDIDIADIGDIDDLSANKNSGNYNSSQTISQSQGGDNTVDSHLLENYNYVEQNEKKWH